MKIEILFDEMTVEINTGEPAALFRVVKALENDGRAPEIRYFDEEIEDTTCWQPLRKAA